MSYWFIVFILLAVIMVVGPIMLMQPSSRDKRIAALRQEAALSGLHVRLSQYHDRQIAVYTMEAIRPKESITWQLSKDRYEHGLHFYNKWQFDIKPSSLQTEQSERLKSYIDKLNDSFVGLELGSEHVGIWWSESLDTATVDEVKKLLSELLSIFH